MPRAPRQCPGDNGQCDELITGRAYCEKHTVPWSGQRTNSSQITSKHVWKHKIVPYILDRDGHQCQIRYPGRCTGRATIVDKIIPASRRPDLALDEENLRAACRPCNEHKARTEDRRPTRARNRR
ncbi:HNH endonuclease [Mycolicibacterium goodii]|uniref:HNH endonuclease n=1 Tax=Mycolicibacterium goodii TaxID=134601 RepID=UPI001BDCEFAE|nr:HNH endonuclease [Mycolicibacterium goodii]MBU8830846.1 HNH endonuclease [Mycolicibacterium goodii]